MVASRVRLHGDLGEGVGIIDPLTNHRWNRFVEKHQFGWITHLAGWKRVLESTFPHMHGYYLALCGSDGEIQAGLPVYLVDSWLTGRRLVSIPFATLCDPLVSGSTQMEPLFRAAVKLSEQIAVPRIEIRTLAAAQFLDQRHFLAHRGLKHHYLRLDPDPEKVMHSFHRSCVRQRIMRAEKSDLRLVKGTGERHLMQFYLLHRKTRKRKGLPPHPYKLVKSLGQAFAGRGMVELLLCLKGEETVAGIMVFRYKDRVSVEYSAVDTAYNVLSPVHLLFWHAIKESCLSGYRILDFGQTSVHNKSLMEFKSHWGTEVADLSHFIYPNDPALVPSLDRDTVGRKLLQYVCNMAPDPALNYLGDFCYRHLG